MEIKNTALVMRRIEGTMKFEPKHIFKGYKKAPGDNPNDMLQNGI